MDIERDSNREAFEAWFAKSHYHKHLIENFWEAWQAAKAQANKQFESFIDQAIEDSACADERRSLQALLDEFQDIAMIEAQEPAND